jgi:hypothetical protein
MAIVKSNWPTRSACRGAKRFDLHKRPSQEHSLAGPPQLLLKSEASLLALLDAFGQLPLHLSTLMAPAQTTDSSVFALIGAFTSGLDVLKKLKKKRRKSTETKVEDDEIRLRRSLQKGPIDLHQEYNQNYTRYGDRYREGDCKKFPFSFSIAWAFETSSSRLSLQPDD